MGDVAKQRFCPYGKPAGHFVDDVGFVFKTHFPSMTKRGMCPACQAVRRLPKAVLDRMTKEEKDERREAARRAAMGPEKEKL